jgi:hypothetical protein
MDSSQPVFFRNLIGVDEYQAKDTDLMDKIHCLKTERHPLGSKIMEKIPS